MRARRALLGLAAAAACAGLGPSRDEDPAAFLREALRAHGGPAALSREGTLVIRGPVKVYFGSRPVEGELIMYRAGADHLKVVSRVRLRGAPAEFIEALDADRAWVTFRGRSYDWPPDNARIELAHDLDIIARAAAPEAAITDLGLVLSGDARLRGLELAEPGGTTRLLFDPESHLLAEMEYKAMESTGEGTSEEKLTRKVYGDYRPENGAAFPHRLAVYKNGVIQMEWTIASLERDVALDMALFGRPEEQDERLYFEEFAN